MLFKIFLSCSTTRSRSSMYSVLLGLYLLIITTSATSDFCTERDVHALLQFKQDLAVKSNALASWETKRHCCEWSGIRCNRLAGQGITLDLSDKQLSGPLPESIGQISILEDLDLSRNSLNGVITEAHFFNLSGLLFLKLSDNPALSFNLSSDWNPPFLLRSLDLSSCKVGPAFPKWILTQTNLIFFYMSNAGISGPIPSKFWDLYSTKRCSLEHIDLSKNQIHGNFPDLSSSKNCSKQRFYKDDFKDTWESIIDLSSNYLHGPLPPLPPNTGNLILSKNMLTGSLSSSLCATQGSYFFSHFFYTLDLSENLLSGEIPDCWVQFQGLLVLNLGKNNFSGKIPTSFGYLSKLYILQLGNNNFSGEFPSLGNNTNLGVVDLGANKLSGKIPTWVGKNLTRLLVLRLRSNKLHGGVPSSLCSLPRIHVLDLSRNNVSGALPYCLYNLTAFSQMSEVDDIKIPAEVELAWKGLEIAFGGNLHRLRSIDISSNHLIGDIPENITSLVRLNSLNLSRNHFTGVLPNNFGQLKMLESLDLSRNELYGTIPASFSSLNYLSVLDLSFNNLSGRIPLSTQLQSFEASAYMGNLGLCGAPLTQRCSGEGTTTQSPEIPAAGRESDHPTDIGLIQLGFYVSMVLGFILGFWGVCGSLVLKTSWRYAYFKFADDIIAKMQRKLQR